MDQTTAKREQVFAAHASIFGAAVIFLISLVIGLLSDSIALLLDAGTGMVILFAAFFVRVVMQKMENPPDHRFNFGYEKYEPLTVTLQNVAIMITCLVGVKFAIQDIIHPEDMVRYDIPAAAAFLSGIIAMCLGLYIRKVSLRIGSSVLRTSATHWFIDGSLSFSMCAGFIVGFILADSGYGNLSDYVDPIMAILLALIFIKIPFKAVTVNVLELLDAIPEKEIHDKIKQIAKNYEPRSLGMRRMRVRKAGRKTFLDIGFAVDENLTVKEAEKIAENFKRDIMREVPNCDAVVYFEHALR